MYTPDFRLKEFIAAMFEVGCGENGEEYEGNLHIHIKSKEEPMKLVGSFPIRTASEKIMNIRFQDGADYYITSNRIKDAERNSSHLFGFSNIVIDIDCHNFVWSKDKDTSEENKRRAKERDRLIVELVCYL